MFTFPAFLLPPSGEPPNAMPPDTANSAAISDHAGHALPELPWAFAAESRGRAQSHLDQERRAAAAAPSADSQPDFLADFLDTVATDLLRDFQDTETALRALAQVSDLDAELADAAQSISRFQQAQGATPPAESWWGKIKQTLSIEALHRAQSLRREQARQEALLARKIAAQEIAHERLVGPKTLVEASPAKTERALWKIALSQIPGVIDVFSDPFHALEAHNANIVTGDALLFPEFRPFPAAEVLVRLEVLGRLDPRGTEAIHHWISTPLGLSHWATPTGELPRTALDERRLPFLGHLEPRAWWSLFASALGRPSFFEFSARFLLEQRASADAWRGWSFVVRRARAQAADQLMRAAATPDEQLRARDWAQTLFFGPSSPKITPLAGLRLLATDTASALRAERSPATESVPVTPDADSSAKPASARKTPPGLPIEPTEQPSTRLPLSQAASESPSQLGSASGPQSPSPSTAQSASHAELAERASLMDFKLRDQWSVQVWERDGFEIFARERERENRAGNTSWSWPSGDASAAQMERAWALMEGREGAWRRVWETLCQTRWTGFRGMPPQTNDTPESVLGGLFDAGAWQWLAAVPAAPAIALKDWVPITPDADDRSELIGGDAMWRLLSAPPAKGLAPTLRQLERIYAAQEPWSYVWDEYGDRLSDWAHGVSKIWLHGFCDSVHGPSPYQAGLRRPIVPIEGLFDIWGELAESTRRRDGRVSDDWEHMAVLDAPFMGEAFVRQVWSRHPEDFVASIRDSRQGRMWSTQAGGSHWADLRRGPFSGMQMRPAELAFFALLPQIALEMEAAGAPLARNEWFDALLRWSLAPAAPSPSTPAGSLGDADARREWASRVKAAFEAERLRAEDPFARPLAQALVSALGIGRDTAGANGAPESDGLGADQPPGSDRDVHRKKPGGARRL